MSIIPSIIQSIFTFLVFMYAIISYKANRSAIEQLELENMILRHRIQDNAYEIRKLKVKDRR